MNRIFESIGYITVGILLLCNIIFSVYVFLKGGAVNIFGGLSLIATSIIVIVLHDCCQNMLNENKNENLNN